METSVDKDLHVSTSFTLINKKKENPQKKIFSPGCVWVTTTVTAVPRAGQVWFQARHIVDSIYVLLW